MAKKFDRKVIKTHGVLASQLIIKQYFTDLCALAGYTSRFIRKFVKYEESTSGR